MFFKTETGSDAEFQDINSLIEEAIISSWYESEVTRASQSNIDSCCGANGRPHHMINHFLQLSVSKANYVGCAISQYSEVTGKTSYLVCNYSQGILDKQMVYESGTAASKCHSGHNPKFPGLCSINEIVEIHYPSHPSTHHPCAH